MTTTAPPKSRGAAPFETTPRNAKPKHRALSKKAAPTLTIYIKAPINRGAGLNDWLFGRALHCAHAGATAESTAAMLHDQVGNQTRTGEIKRAVERAFAKVRGTAGSVGNYQPAAAWPQTDHESIVRFVELKPRTVADVIAASPATPPDHPLDVLRQLHSADDEALLCLGQTPTGGFQTLTFAQWERRRDEIAQWEMCVPNLMRAPHAVNFDGHRSARCRNNSCGIGHQRFAVLDLDIRPDDESAVRLGMAPPDICSTLILRAVNLQKLRAVIHSGSKSLHAWIDVAGLSQDEIAGYFRTWCSYGGDKAGRLPEQQFRLPGGYRADKGTRQTVLWWSLEGAR